MSGEWQEDEVRSVVHQLWCEMLGIDPEALDLQRGFVESGGYSLVALRLLDAIGTKFQVDVDFASVFSDATAASLADSVIALLRENATPVGKRETEFEEGFI